MTQLEFFGALEYIEGQLESGYIDLGPHDYDELEIVKRAIEEFKSNHEQGDI